jgi:hypothetical protein
MLGAELDILAQEAWRAACRWGGRRVPEVAEIPGKEEFLGEGELVLDDEQFAWEDKASGVRWLLVPDTVHAFDQSFIGLIVRDKVLVEDATIKTDKTMRIIGEWLLEGPFKDEGTA